MQGGILPLNRRRVIRRIPKGARIQAAGSLATLIDMALGAKTGKAWARLLLSAFLALHVPSRDQDSADSSTLTTKIKRQISTYMESDFIATVAADTSTLNWTGHRKPKRHQPQERTSEILQRRWQSTCRTETCGVPLDCWPPVTRLSRARQK